MVVDSFVVHAKAGSDHGQATARSAVGVEDRYGDAGAAFADVVSVYAETLLAADFQLFVELRELLDEGAVVGFVECQQGFSGGAVVEWEAALIQALEAL